MLVEKHIAMQHSTGLYHKIKNVSTPEDIAKWIAERRRKYPTKANVELRKAEELEKVQRGEIIKQKQDVTKNRKKKIVCSRNRKRTVQKQPSKISHTVEQKETYRGLSEFCGTLNLRDINLTTETEIDNGTIENVPEEIVNHISDEEEESFLALPEPVIITSSLPRLVANYESSEESDAPQEVPIKKVKLDNLAEKDAVGEKKSETSDSVHVDRSTQERPNLQSTVNKRSKNTKSKHKQNTELNKRFKNKEQTKVQKKQPYTSQLLQKLLSRSIQHERNLICQCIKYIVDNKFFDG